MRLPTFAPVACVVLSGVASAAGCTIDPVHSNAVSALGPEAATIPQGQYHRAGQPCAVCHGSEGPASSVFSIAGTVFFGPALNSTPIGVGNVTVQFEDDAQSKFQVKTNCVGNFWVTPGAWNPQFPVLVTIGGQPQGTYLQISMQSHIGRDPSCGDCHKYPTNLDYFQTPGIIHLASADDPSFKGDPMCPVQPPVPAAFGGP